MKNLRILPLLFAATLLVFSCSDDDNETPAPDLSYTIVNSGQGGVTVLDTSGDAESLGVAQPIPAVGSSEGYPVNMPVMLFFNDKIYLNSIEDNFEVTMDGEAVGGNISIGEAANGFALLTFIPYEPYTPNTVVNVLLKSDFQDDSGNGLVEDFELNFSISNFNVTTFDGNSSFENGSDGVLFVGDGEVMNGTQGCVTATDGNNFAAITSGDAIVSSDFAVGGATSLTILGPISTDISNVSFEYNFLSSEFQEFVGSVFDDSFVATVVGPNGTYTEIIDSVNTIGTNNTDCVGFPNMPDTGDNYAGETGWQTRTMNFQQVGSPAFIIFTVTDVSDLIYSSVVTLDEVTYN